MGRQWWRQFAFSSAVALLAVADPVVGQSTRPSSFSASFSPGISVPLGDSAKVFGLGGVGELTVDWRLPTLPLVFLGAGAQFGYDGVQYVSQSTSTLAGNLRLGIQTGFTDWLGLKAWGAGGWYASGLNNAANALVSQNPLWGAGSALVAFGGPFQGTVGVGYDQYLGLRSALTVKVGFSFTPPEASGRPSAPVRGPQGVLIRDIRVEPLFPVFYHYYAKHPIGRLVIENRESHPVTNLHLGLSLKQFMDAEFPLEVPSTVAPGQSVEVPLYALFSDRVVQNVTEGTEVLAELNWDFEYQGESVRRTDSTAVRFYDRNAMSWDDNRRAAAFVTAKDPVVQSFAKNVLSTLKPTFSPALNPNLQTAAALQIATVLQGVVYAPDPKTPYSEYSASKTAVDYLQFPRQTLQFRAGDCDDLSILASALLESVGIETAFITTPGHIFIAFSTGLTPEQAGRQFGRADQVLILNRGLAWVPLEVTDRNGFLSAWDTGAREWREAAVKGQAGFYPVRDAWSVYEPSALPVSAGEGAVAPPAGALTLLVKGEVDRYVQTELDAVLPALLLAAQKAKSSPASLNALGVAYARWGRYDQAKAQFVAASKASTPEYAPAVVNLANLALLAKDPQAAVLADRAVALAPQNPRVLEPAARVLYASGQFDRAAAVARTLGALDPEAGRRLAFTAPTTGRAADATDNQPRWEDWQP